MEHRAVATDGNDEVEPVGEFLDRGRVVREARRFGFSDGHSHLDTVIREPRGRGLRERVRERSIAVGDDADRSDRGHESS